MNKNKASGKYFEDKIAKLIRNVLRTSNLSCRRASHSGSSGFEFGDIYFNDYEKYDMVFECKFTKQKNLSILFPVLNKSVENYIKQNQQEVSNFKKKLGFEPKYSGVVFGIKNGPILFITLKRFDIDNYIHVKTKKLRDIYIYDFTDILEVIKSDAKYR